MSPSIEARNDQLDGLRGYAAIAVVLFHSILSPDPDNGWSRVVSKLLQDRELV
jgi:peptidoglycan/LPS O-acetylase OafA/YrhL